MTPLAPEYGDTPVEPDDAAAFTQTARELLGDAPTNADVYDLEQALLEETASELLADAASGALGLDELITDRFLRELHSRLYKEIWTWGGSYRTRELTIGVPPEQVAVAIREALDTVRYRWDRTSDWTPRQLGIAVHAEAVRIHPFVDGNGRSSRLLADLVFVAAHDGGEYFVYDWEIEKFEYIARLRRYDQSRDPAELAAYIPILPVQ